MQVPKVYHTHKHIWQTEYLNFAFPIKDPSHGQNQGKYYGANRIRFMSINMASIIIVASHANLFSVII